MLKAIKDRLLRDPGSNGGTTPAATLPAATPPAVTPPAATPAKEEPKEIQYYSLPVVEGEPWNVTANELFQLAQLGANSIAEKQKKGSNTPESDSEPEDEIVTLRREVRELKQGREQEQTFNQINQTLHTENQKYDATKEDPELAALINAAALAQYNMNPRIPLATYHSRLFKIVEAKIAKGLEKEKEKTIATRRIGSIVNTTQRGSAVPAVEKTKEFKAEDVKTGASRRALQGFLQQLSIEQE